MKRLRVLRIVGFSVAEQDGDGIVKNFFDLYTQERVKLSEAGGWRVRQPKSRDPEEKSWRSLARFVSKLALKDSIWASAEQLPLCILSVLHKQLPKCRLHVHTFDLRSVCQDDEHGYNISNEEYALATLPAFHSIIEPYGKRDIKGRPDYSEEMVMHMVAGATPNLRYVYLWFSQQIPGYELNMSVADARLPWKGRLSISTRRTARNENCEGQLGDFTISPFPELEKKQLMEWGCCANFGKLRTIRLSGNLSLEVLRQLGELAEREVFACLEVVELGKMLMKLIKWQLSMTWPCRECCRQ